MFMLLSLLFINREVVIVVMQESTTHSLQVLGKVKRGVENDRRWTKGRNSKAEGHLLAPQAVETAD